MNYCMRNSQRCSKSSKIIMTLLGSSKRLPTGPFPIFRVDRIDVPESLTLMVNCARSRRRATQPWNGALVRSLAVRKSPSRSDGPQSGRVTDASLFRPPVNFRRAARATCATCSSWQRWDDMEHNLPAKSPVPAIQSGSSHPISVQTSIQTNAARII